MLAHENPFATDRLESLLYFRPEWSGTSWDAIEAQWSALNYRGSLIGKHGAGKSTLLSAFAQRLRNKGELVQELFLNDQDRKLPVNWNHFDGFSEHYIFLDGEEQLNFLGRVRFYQATQSAKGVIVTRHSPGKLKTIIELESSFNTLTRTVKTISSDHYPVLEPSLNEWWQMESGNIRNILLRCYDFLADSNC